MSPIRPENRDRYPADWPEITRRIKHDRAGRRCECTGECGNAPRHSLMPEARCAARHAQPAPWNPNTIIVLTTAHLNHQPEDCRDENLRAMCQACHLAYDRAHHEETRAANAPQQPLFGLGQS